MLVFATMRRVSMFYPAVIQSVLALVLALNALGWAAHIDVSRLSGSPQSPHAHVSAYAQAAAQQSDIGQSAVAGDHCEHSNAHHTGLLTSTARIAPAATACIARPPAENYVSVAHQPPLDPPIA